MLSPTRPVFHSVYRAWGQWLLLWSLWELAPSPSESAATRAQTPAESLPAAAPTQTAAPKSAKPSPTRCWLCAAPGRSGTRYLTWPLWCSGRAVRVLRRSKAVLILGRRFCDFLFLSPTGCMEARRSFGPLPSLQMRLQRLNVQENKQTY